MPSADFTDDGSKDHGAEADIVFLLQQGGHGTCLVPVGLLVLLALEDVDRLEHADILGKGLVRGRRREVGASAGDVTADLSVQNGLVLWVEEQVVLVEAVVGGASPASVAIFSAAPVTGLSLKVKES